MLIIALPKKKKPRPTMPVSCQEFPFGQTTVAAAKIVYIWDNEHKDKTSYL